MDLDPTGTGVLLSSSYESTLTPLQQAVIIEHQKILLTLNQINASLLQTIAATTASGPVQTAQKQAVARGSEVFKKALVPE